MSISTVSYQDFITNQTRTKASDKESTTQSLHNQGRRRLTLYTSLGNNFEKSKDSSFFSKESHLLATAFKINTVKEKEVDNILHNELSPKNELNNQDNSPTNTIAKQELSDNVLELMSKQGLNQKDVLASHSFGSGAAILVYATNSSSDGQEKSYQVAIMQADGSIKNQSITENTVFSDDGRGNIIPSFVQSNSQASDKETNAAATQGILGTKFDDFIINISATNINSNDGNDTIVNLNTATDIPISINLGNDNNTVISLTNKAVDMQIFAKDGNNHIKGAANLNGTFGNGNNVIDAKTSQNLHFGNGNNTLSVENIEELFFGNGDNLVYSEKASKIYAGNGNNIMKIKMLTNAMDLGNGNNDVTVEKLYDADYLATYKTYLKDGSTAHLLFPPSKPEGADIQMGDGNNTLQVNRTLEDDSELNKNIGSSSNINLGNGNNNVNLSTLGEFMNFRMGDGDNILNIDYANTDFSLGSGNNLVQIHKADYLGLSANTGHTTLIVNSDISQINFKNQGTSDILINGSIMGGSISNANRNDKEDAENSLTVLGHYMQAIVNNKE